MSKEEVKKPKTITGLVVSDKMEKTVVVKVSYKMLHPLYKKYINRSKKYKVHDEENNCKIGDFVRIESCRPLSKEKYWKLNEVLERAK